MTQTVDFIFDFASPNAYFVHKALPAIAERTGATFNYIPCLLGGIFKATNNQAPVVSFADVKGKLDYEMLEIQRFIKAHGLSSFKWNSHFPVNSLMLIRAAVAMDMNNDPRLAEYYDVGLRLLWEADKKMDDPEVFVSEFNAAEFDGEALLAVTQQPEVKAQLIANTEAAVARKCFGVPTFYVGDEMFFGKDRLAQVEAEIMRAG